VPAGSRTVKADRNFEVVWDGAVLKYTASVPVEQGLLICFSGSMVAFFGVIDIAERPEVYYQCGQIGRFIARSRTSWHHGKRKYLSFQHIFTKRKKTRICHYFLL